MACKASRAPFLQNIAKRGLSAVSCPRAVGQTADFESCVLGNKVVVAAANSFLPVTRVSIVFRAGARNESYDSQGASHMLRIALGLGTKNSTGFAITRNIQQVGGSLTATSDREIVSYTVETTSDQIEVGLRYLQDVIEPTFKPWELSDSIGRVKYQVASVPPQVRAVELMHKAAFRTGLGNSIYIPKFQIGKLSSECLQHFVANNFTGNRCAVVGVGIDHNTLSGFAQSLDLPTGSQSKSVNASYYGGDIRKDTPGDKAHVAVCGQGAALLSQKEALAFAVLQHAVGSGTSTKYGNINGSFGKALSAAVGNENVSYASLNASYSDAGLFGFIVSADSDVICKAVAGLTGALKSGSVSDEDFNRGKALLKTAVLESYSTDSSLINEIGLQAILTKQILTIDNLIAAIESLQLKDVQDAAKKVAGSKLSMGAVGNLGSVPYISELS
ncbi:cytochrome b-c1 complex subunit 2, mitochondrial [Teleopsis dalmanni]|uniref:cytochrome b-c1 complex subunit 2, mitochondrial n=1 Tax=Teleopsis dalmanni TaxID=139649 RepID=UPI000D329E84|nr:cytochrome b-c1 complex subunit 2, mitochondrial [Teleopsis dalmanni]